MYEETAVAGAIKSVEITVIFHQSFTLLLREFGMLLA